MKTKLLIAKMRDNGMKWSEIARLVKIDVTRLRGFYDGEGVELMPEEVERIARVGV